jgi:DNA-binding beta-propeller fold protein YncE
MQKNPRRPGKSVLVYAAAFLSASATASTALADADFTAFESGQVRPLAMSPDGNLLFAANTPDNRLEVFRITAAGLTHRSSIPVGLEPVAVAARSNQEVWVVNHLSDSVSVVRLNPTSDAGRVVQTLLVGDEPRDIVFGGPGKSRAFITAAHRGQNVPFDPQPITPGVGRADVWVFDANQLGSSLGGTPLTIIPLFTDSPRALAVSHDGAHVYAAGFHTGNRTTIIPEALVPDGGEQAGGLLGPMTNADGVTRPETGLIVKFNGSDWVDKANRVWNTKVNFNLPDKDVFVIDATASPPAQVPGSQGFFTGVGTILFNMAVNPVSGKVYVSNTEARNDDLFEGPGTFAGTSLRGHLHESRITVLSSTGVAPRHLNKHINYATCCAPLPNAENDKSLAFPVEMAVTSDGQKLYVAALGSSKIGVFNTNQIENDTFVPNASHHVEVSGGGPTGLVLDEPRGRLYVLTRFDNSISIVNTALKVETAHLPMYNPEPPSITAGRRFLYDARHTSSHGDSACASCHAFGDVDSLAWDLGNPDGAVMTNPGPFISFPFPTGSGDFHPMKGPMVTQSLRGLAGHGAMHWRGDRTGGNDEPSSQPDSGTFNEEAAFKKFNGAFVDLLGRSEELSESEMQAFTDFILQVSYPPNPYRPLNNVLNAEQQAGEDFYMNRFSDIVGPCVHCHVINPEEGYFGTDGMNSFEPIPQFMKVPHLQNAYQKIGMFGMVENPAIFNHGDFTHQGDQIRGFGFGHDGFIDSLFRFTTTAGFELGPLAPDGIPAGAAGEAEHRQIAHFMLAFPTKLEPAVGQQVTLTSANFTAAGSRIALLRARADAGGCDLVAKTRIAGQDLGFVYTGNGFFNGDRQALPPVHDILLRQIAIAAQRELTYTCVPPGSGVRIGIDRDSDGHLDGDEIDAGTNPANPASP